MPQFGPTFRLLVDGQNFSKRFKAQMKAFVQMHNADEANGGDGGPEACGERRKDRRKVEKVASREAYICM